MFHPITTSLQIEAQQAREAQAEKTALSLTNSLPANTPLRGRILFQIGEFLVVVGNRLQRQVRPPLPGQRPLHQS